jgi:intracellular sulfur oxidation DsrE/DsrF family protein
MTWSTSILKTALVAVATIVLSTASAAAQEPGGDRHAGPILESFGRHIDLPDAAFAIPTDRVYKVAFEVMEPLRAPERVHPRLEAAARLVNMYAHAGVPKENLVLALVLHGGGTQAAMTNAAYQQRHDVENPSLPLLEALADAGVEIYLCEQSRVANRVGPNEVAPPVKRALSAITTLVTLQADGYQFLTY